MRDGVHQVGFAKADAPVKEKRIEGDRASFGHPTGSGMGQFIRLADNEAVESKARIQRSAGQVIILPGAAAKVGFRGWLRRRRAWRRGHREFQPINLGPCVQKVAADLISIVALHPITEEGGRNLKLCDTVLKVGQPQRLYPGHIVVLANALHQRFANLAPSFVRHLCPTCKSQFPAQRRNPHNMRPSTNRPLAQCGSTARAPRSGQDLKDHETEASPWHMALAGETPETRHNPLFANRNHYSSGKQPSILWQCGVCLRIRLSPKTQ